MMPGMVKMVMLRIAFLVIFAGLALGAAGEGLGAVAQAGEARVVIDMPSGTVVMTEGVRIGTVAVAHGRFRVHVTDAPKVAHPGPFAQAGKTVIVPRTRIQVDEGRRGKLIILPTNASLRELVDRLIAAGVSPRELGRILQAIKAAGALQAEIIVR